MYSYCLGVLQIVGSFPPTIIAVTSYVLEVITKYNFITINYPTEGCNFWCYKFTVQSSLLIIHEMQDVCMSAEL